MSVEIILFSIGFGLLFGGYTDLMRGSRSGVVSQNMFNTLTELFGGILTIAFFVWAFFVFAWWIVILATLFGSFLSAFIKHKFFNLPQFHIILGAIACLYVLM